MGKTYAHARAPRGASYHAPRTAAQEAANRAEQAPTGLSIAEQFRQDEAAKRAADHRRNQAKAAAAGAKHQEHLNHEASHGHVLREDAHAGKDYTPGSGRGNPYHDRKGEFTSQSGAVTTTRKVGGASLQIAQGRAREGSNYHGA